MTLSRERKVLLAVAGAAGLLVLADRVVLDGTGGTPASASATVSPAAATAVTNFNDPPVTAGPNKPSLRPSAPPPHHHHRPPPPSLADRLAHAGRHLPDATPDAFRPGPRWRAAGPDDGPARPGRGFDPEAFLRDHRLEAVTRGHGQATAMVNGRPIHLGTVRQGMTLRQIDERGVVWVGHGVRLQDRLEPDR